MFSILIVSHSAEIALGVKKLADQMVQGQVAVAAAGGLPDGELGTSVDMISAALVELPQEQGVLVLVDLGSAVMSAEMAMELSTTEYLISRAPIVEGALVAAVQASMGADMYTAALAAEQALAAKQAAIAPVATETAATATPPAATAGNNNSIVLTIDHKDGLHMRPATPFVQTAARFKSKIRARNLDRPDSPEVDAKSMVAVMTMTVRQGQRVRLQAEGEDAAEALATLAALVARNFESGA
jgi:phosphoenolpyruvate---glycerone phosphotransferase subunit DhaM